MPESSLSISPHLADALAVVDRAQTLSSLEAKPLAVRYEPTGRPRLYGAMSRSRQAFDDRDLWVGVGALAKAHVDVARYSAEADVASSDVELWRSVWEPTWAIVRWGVTAAALGLLTQELISERDLTLLAGPWIELHGAPSRS